MRTGSVARVRGLEARDPDARNPRGRQGGGQSAGRCRKSRPVAISNVTRFWSNRRGGRASAAAVPDGLDAFGSEEGSVPAVTSPSGRAHLWVAGLVVVVLGAALGVAATKEYQRRYGAAAPSHLTVETNPAGLEVTIDGTVRGRTPLAMALAPGTYEVVIGSGAGQRVVRASLAPGMSLVERVEMPPPAISGSLRVDTEPSGLPVVIDGVARGLAPVAVGELLPGDHQVLVGTEGRQVSRTVAVRPDETVSLLVAVGGPPAVSGRTTSVALSVPNGSLSINAQPWADVWLDGRPLGSTPIGNVSVPIGSHELVFRHPEFGERRATVSIGLQEPARIGMDMRKQ
jgi:hypothetical protein